MTQRILTTTLLVLLCTLRGVAAQEPTAVVSTGVSDFALQAPKIFWHTASGCPAPPPHLTYGGAAASGADSGSGAAAEDPEVLSRVATYGGQSRELFASNAPRDPGVCNPYKFYSRRIVADDDYIYWVDDSGLVRLSTDANVGDAPELLSDAIDGKNSRSAVELTQDGTHVFAITTGVGDHSTIWQVNKSDGAATPLATTGGRASDLSTDGEYVYWIDRPDLAFRRFALVDSSQITIASGVTGYYAEGARPLCSAMVCIISKYIFVSQGTQVMRFNNLSNDIAASATLIYTSTDASARVYSMTTDENDLFLFEDRTVPCFPEPCFPSHNDVSVRTGRRAGRVDVLYLNSIGFSGGTPSEWLTTDSGFLFWQQNGSVARLPNNSAALPMTNMRVTSIEVTQVVQNTGNSVRLIQNRRTFVRVHVRADGPPVNGVTALLLGTWNGDAERGGPLEPVNSVGKTITVYAAPDRNRINDSFLFELPWDWTTHSDLRLRAILNPFGVPLQANYDNNVLAVGPLHFDPSPRLQVQFVAFGYRLNNTTYYPRLKEDILGNYSWIRRVYPLASTPGFFTDPGPGLRTNLWTVFDEGLGARVAQTIKPECKDNLCASAYTNVLLQQMRTDNNIDNKIFLYGMISDGGGFPRGQACCGTSVSSGPAGNDFIGYYAGHEIGHTLGRGHPKMGDKECGLDGGDPDPSYPHAHIGPNDGSVAGFDAGDPAFMLSPSVLRGDTTIDFMAYCQPEWISDTNYENLYQFMTANPPPTGAAAAPVSGDFLSVMGDIAPDAGTGHITHLRPLDSVPSAPDRQPGDYSIELLHADGNVLASYAFTPHMVEDAETPTLSFSEVVRFVAGTATIRLRSILSGTVLATQPASPHPPTISDVTLQDAASPVTGTVTVAWTASDPDSDPLHFEILYSRDSGATFRPVSMNLTAMSAPVDTALLGGGTAVLRVIVDDGFQTAQADSPPFTVADKAPQPRILLPADGTSVHYGQLVNFSGEAEDAQDGGVTGDRLVWSSASGELGHSALLSVTNLPVGTNHITLTATNTAGLSGSTSITVFVDDDLVLPGPTLSVAPSQVAWNVEPGSTQPQTAQISISNGGSGALFFAASTDAAWLTVDPTSSTGPATITLTADPTGFASGTDTRANLLLRVAGVTGPTLSVPVTLSVGSLYVGPPSTPPASCVGDCDCDCDGDGNSDVTVNELITMVNIALGNQGLDSCSAGDKNADGQITIDEIVTAVGVALNECPTA